MPECQLTMRRSHRSPSSDARHVPHTARECNFDSQLVFELPEVRGARNPYRRRYARHLRRRIALRRFVMRVVRLLAAFLVLAAPLRAQTRVRLVPMPDTSGAALAAALETALLSSPSFVLKHDAGGRQLRVGLMSGGSGSCGEATISSYTL